MCTNTAFKIYFAKSILTLSWENHYLKYPDNERIKIIENNLRCAFIFVDFLTSSKIIYTGSQ